MIPLTETERGAYYLQHRWFRFWICPAALLLLIVLAVVPLVFAWLQRAFWGLPYIGPNPASASGTASGRTGFLFGFGGATSSFCSSRSCWSAADYRF